jgi:UDP-4-amino-4-deoxy-L-arabinose-oxoglutarate aminotransferase
LILRPEKEIPHSKPWITQEDKDEVLNTLNSGMVAQGELATVFEEKIARFNDCVGAVSFSSATAALVLAFQTLGISAGSEVILPTYVCSSILRAIQFVGAIPVVCDIGDDTWNMTTDTVEPHITNKTAAIIIVHMFGVPADTHHFKDFDIPLIEDCAQALGAEHNGEKVGSIGDVGILSFNATKCMTSGEGGMVVARHAYILDKIRDHKNRVSNISPLSDLQAALGLAQLNRYSEILDRRKNISDFYFKSLPARWTERLRGVRSGNIFFRFPLYIDDDFETVEKEMAKRRIVVRRGVDLLLHALLGLDSKSFPNGEACFKKTLSIPLYPALSLKECSIITQILQEVLV